MSKILYCASVWAHLRNFHLPYIRELERNGWDVHVAAAGIPESARFAHSHALPFQKKLLGFGNVRALLQLVRLIRRERFQVIYAHTTLAAFLCRLAVLFSFVRSSRVVYVCHGYFFEADDSGRVKRNPRSLFYLACEKMLAPLTSALVLMNRADYASALRYRLGRDIRFSHGMGLAIAPETPAPKRSDHIIFLCVGEFSKRKNQAEIIRAFAAMQNPPASLRLWFAGDGALLDKCKSLADRLGVAGAVTFWGHCDHMERLYRQADVLLAASRSEGLPFCVMEALHFGLPVIASDVKGHRDLIAHDRNGLLYRDNRELAAYMEQLGHSARERRRLAEQASLPETYYLDAAMREFRAVIGVAAAKKRGGTCRPSDKSFL